MTSTKSTGAGSGRRLLTRSRTVARTALGRALRVLWPRAPFFVARLHIRRNVRRALADPARSAEARRQMEHLLGGVGRSDEVEDAAMAYLEHWVTCDVLRWHPRRITRQRVEGAENLRRAHDAGKGVVLSFVHHGYFAGIFASVARTGIPVKAVAAALESPGPQFLQHLRVVGSGGGIVSAAGGTAGLVEELTRGAVVAAAIDVPGGSEMTFAGRRVRCSSGAAHAAVRAGAPVVVLTSHHDAAGAIIRLSEPIYPDGHRGAGELLTELVRRHEAAVLAWPATAYIPTVCWTPVEGSE